MNARYDVNTNPDPNLYKENCHRPNPWRMSLSTTDSTSITNGLSRNIFSFGGLDIDVTFNNLNGSGLGETLGNGNNSNIVLDDNAAGHGWFVEIVTRVRRIGRALISAAHCAACVFNRPIIRRNALRLFTPHILGSRHEPLPAWLLTWHARNAALLLPLRPPAD